jgi:hypothetical protein
MLQHISALILINAHVCELARARQHLSASERQKLRALNRFFFQDSSTNPSRSFEKDQNYICKPVRFVFKSIAPLKHGILLQNSTKAKMVIFQETYSFVLIGR